MKLRSASDSPHPDTREFSEMVDRYMPLLSGSMVAELLDRHVLKVCGLGLFSVRHYPAERRTGNDGVTYYPPVNRIVLERRKVSSSDFAAMLSRRTDLEDSVIHRLAEILPAFIADRIRENDEILFPGFGRVYSVQSALSFEPDQSLSGILNSEYYSLEAISLSSAEPDALRGRRKMLFLVPMFIMIILATGAYLFYYPVYRKPDTSAPMTAVLFDQQLQSTSVSRNDTLSASMPTGGGILLEEGEYAVVLGTFRKKETAERGIGSVSVSGAVVFIWPVTGKGKRYYRLAVGRFASFDAAEAWMDSTGFGRSGKAYVQQAKRRVVLHGEEGM
ncbi:MAG: SPOR domain-containing protein [Chlorobiaceae bacterium]|jgi:hypothetical protein|nr:SPOR domain-containing protein [Chlorobiaceae bacterium]